MDKIRTITPERQAAERANQLLIKWGRIAIFSIGLANAFILLYGNEWNAATALIVQTWLIAEIWKEVWTKSA